MEENFVDPATQSGSAILLETRRRVGWSQRELALAAGVPQSTVVRIERGSSDPSIGTLKKLLHVMGAELMLAAVPFAPRVFDAVELPVDDQTSTLRSKTIGPTSRPVSIPDDFAIDRERKPRGKIKLPRHVYWSEENRIWDLSDDRVLRHLYETVMTEGRREDVTRYLDIETLLEHWDSLVLSSHVREAWSDWLRQRNSFF